MTTIWGQHADTVPMRKFIKEFYQASDIPGNVEEWLSFFAEGAVVQMGDNAPVGEKEALRDMRRRMWIDVKTRKHTVARVFPARFEDWQVDDLGFMAFGSVQYTGHGDGTKEWVKDWSAQGRLKREDGIYRLASYRVYFADHHTS